MGKYRFFKVIGLQRTGTNWIAELIKENFVVEEYGKGFWKHLTPLGTKPDAPLLHYSGNPSDLYFDSEVFYIGVSKSYDLWVKSLRRNTEDYMITHSTTNKRAIYDSWMEWKSDIEHTENFYYENYMDWLESWEDNLLEIEYITNWERKHTEFHNVSDVPQSPDFDINNYL